MSVAVAVFGAILAGNYVSRVQPSVGVSLKGSSGGEVVNNS